jgi:prolyl oligopeptidase
MIMLRTCSAGALALALLSHGAAMAQESDPHLALEVVESPESLAWVKAQNDKTLPILSGDPRFAGLQAQALTILSAKDRIAAPTFIGQDVFNFWQDETHVRGVWRRTSLASYKTATPRGKPSSIWTPWPRPRARTGSGRAPTAGPRPMTAAC